MFEDLTNAPKTRRHLWAGAFNFSVEFRGVFVVSDSFGQTVAFESASALAAFIQGLLIDPAPQSLFTRMAATLRTKISGP